MFKNPMPSPYAMTGNLPNFGQQNEAMAPPSVMPQQKQRGWFPNMSPTNRNLFKAAGMALASQRPSMFGPAAQQMNSRQQDIDRSNATSQHMAKWFSDRKMPELAQMAANGAWKEATAIYKMQTSQAQKPTSAQQNYEYGLKNPGFVTRQNELGKLGGTNITNTMGGQTNEFRKQVDKNDATFFGDVVKGGLKGQSNLNTINRLDSLLSGVETGAGAKIKQMAGSMGIAVQGVSDIQAAEALIAKLVPEQREPGSGAMSDGDLAMFLKSLPQIINQPEGNRLIIDTIRGLAEFEVEKGKIASKVFDSTNDYNRTDGRRDLLALKATFRERLTPQVNQIRNATPQQDDGLDAELKKRGL